VRLMDIPVDSFGVGVEALWSDSAQSVVAFAGEKLVWAYRSQFEEWIDKLMEKPAFTAA